MTQSSRSERLFRALLRLYPSSFREVYGRDATELFRDRLREARRAGGISVALLWLRTIPNVVANGLIERMTHRDGVILDSARVALRSLVRSPALTAAIVATLGVGIGANVGLFAVLRSVLIRPLPYPDPSELVQLWEVNPEVDDELHGPSPWNFVDWQRSASSFESMTAWYLTSGTYRTEAWIEELRSAQVSPDFFRTLGVSPALGRDFRPEEVDRYGPVILSHRTWMRLFGGDPSVVGQSIIASGNSYEIIGVMPPDFTYPDASVETWVAWDIPAAYEDNPGARTWRFLGSMGRLRDGVSTSAAADEMSVISSGLSETYPRMNGGWGAALTSLHEDTVGEVRGTLWLAFGAVASILLIACANVANLLLSRVPTRVRALSVRGVLGASRARIASELVLENIILGLLSGVVGLGLGQAFVELLVRLDAGRIPRLDEVTLDMGVFGFTVLVALGTSLVFGVSPLLALVKHAEPGTPRGGTRTTASGSQRGAREVFVASQLAMTLVLLTGAGLFSTSLERLTAVDPGLDPQSVGAFRVSLDPQGGSSAEIVTYYEGLLREIERVPGVLSVGAAQTLALSPIANDFRRPYRPLGSTDEAAEASSAQMRIVTDGYMETLGMRFLDGGALPRGVTLDEPLVAVVNRTLAERLFPGDDAVGESFELDFRGGWLPYRITGVVEDVRHYGLREEVAPEVFLAHGQMPYLAMNVVVKTTGEPELLFESLRAAVLGHLPAQPPHNFLSMEGLVRESTAEERFLAALLQLFAMVALLLAITGVYGVIAYAVGHRRREIGVRMALGAQPTSIVRSVFRRAIVVAAAGVIVGLISVGLLGGVLESLLFGVSAFDLSVTMSVALILLGAAGVAAWLPARRAAFIPPSESLRSP